jgi:hypothetical protein
MIVVGIILSFVGLGFLCWLLFTLAVHALPTFVGITTGFAAYHSGSGEIGAILVGLIAGALILAAGQIAIATFRSPLIRIAISLLFAVPAAMAGYHAVLGFARFCVPAEVLQQTFALIGSIAVGGTAGCAWRSRSRPIPDWAMAPDANRRYRWRPRPKIAEVSRRHIFGWGCPADPASAGLIAITRSLFSEALRPGGSDAFGRQTRVCDASAASGPG